MASRTQLVCLCEGERGRSIDEVFINRLMKSLEPSWLRRSGSNAVRLVACGSRTDVIKRMPAELRACLAAGGETTLMVWADCDHDCADPVALREKFWEEAQAQGITRAQFETVVFALPKDRLENWIEALQTGGTDESREGPRVGNNREASEAAKKLAKFCKTRGDVSLPPSLVWTCQNWHGLVERMR